MASEDGEALGPYVTSLSAGDVERIRQWHERAYADARAWQAADLTFDYLGLTLIVPSEVQPITPVSHLLGQAVLAEVHAGEHVLEMGTGRAQRSSITRSAGTIVRAGGGPPFFNHFEMVAGW